MENESLFERAANTGVYLQERLRKEFSDHPHVGEVRGLGLIAAIDVVTSRETRKPFDPARKLPLRMYRRLLAKGVIARAAGVSGIAVCPPYIIERDEIDTIIGAMRESLDEIMDEEA
jgi:adenosylmethionine-8-amino-7-oxononanoate aminotransferase